MNVGNLIAALARKHFVASPQKQKPPRTAVPLRASQGSAVEIEIVPIVLANAAGSIFGTDVKLHGSVVAVGQFSLFNSAVRYYHVYLDSLNGGFLSLAMRGTAIIETRLYRLYTEAYPEYENDTGFWNFWMSPGMSAQDIAYQKTKNPAFEPEENYFGMYGYIGSPVAKNLDADGGLSYPRSWAGGNEYVRPFTPIETVLDAAGGVTRLHHNMMHYSRPLGTDNKIAEHLLVSAMAESSTYPSGVTFWVGIDVEPSEVKVYPAADAPAFP